MAVAYPLALGLSLLPFFLHPAHAITNNPNSADSSCRCFPTDPCWPSPSEWSAFNSSLGGKLIATVPLGSVCHRDGPFAAYDASACSQLQDVWPLPSVHYSTPSSPMAAWFANFSCDPFLGPDSTCTVGSLVQYAVNVTDPEDVRQTLQFTRTHNIRLVIRNTGHDYLGKSTGAGAVALWMHHLKHTAYRPQYASPTYTGPALQLGAGVQGFEAMKAAHAQGKVLVTGNCPSVGVVGGYAQGGGHGQLASKFGLAADQVLEWEVMTAAGDVVTASPTLNSDLYWALSGGGGGTYAVVLSATVKVYPDLRTSTARLAFSGKRGSSQHFWEVVHTFMISLLPLLDAGAAAIWLISDSTFSLAPVTLPGGSLSQLQAGLAPTLQLLQRYNLSYSYEIDEFPTFYQSYETMNPASNITEYQIGGRLISRSDLAASSRSILSALQAIVHTGAAISGVSVNVSRTPPPRNAVNPIWRDAAISFTLGVPYSYTNRTLDLENQALVTNELVPRLAALSPGGGAYLNEGDFNQPDWQWVFYGRNYERLTAVKDKYDPEHVFYGRTAVGSERWIEQQDGHLCPVASSVHTV
ncbi:FAD-binding oxidoreductase [Aspergillus clavatus NRRL 1]|uniref:FAD binding domain protein n=1 Tax=Aspergillus clavatus (strain ATCC 1007 / CBS 513.65 / DSM 816 / NCTC 3887 / NRRL 1 / QM 1276 / 107) TaxID=344612 RepID=A1C4K8_ASPCL|nr:FAD binding domain protein [Aspergillus clavatus NRRL 1]EAW15348.1 FAD binding domain protein [Aspergillus clavatus NRRL 1]